MIYAFLIGVCKANCPANNLPYVGNDCACIADAITDAFKDVQIITCGNDGFVTFEDFQKTIEKYKSEVNVGDTVILYFSGHGGWKPHVLLFSNGTVNFNHLCSTLDTLGSSSKILIIDSCHSGAGILPDQSEIEPTENIQEYIRTGYALFASSREDESSFPFSKKKNQPLYICFC